MYEAGKILHSLPAELQLRRYSAGRSNKLMNTETYSLNYTDLNAMTRLWMHGQTSSKTRIIAESAKKANMLYKIGTWHALGVLDCQYKHPSRAWRGLECSK